MLKNFEWVSMETWLKLMSSPLINLVNVCVLLSEISNPSSKISLGITNRIGLWTYVRTSGADEKLRFGWTPTCKSLNTNGLLPCFLSNRSGWLHTFLNCITKFIKFSIFCLFSARVNKSFAEILSLILWYKILWRKVMSQNSSTSVLGPISCSTSLLSRRNMKGFNTAWRRFS